MLLFIGFLLKPLLSQPKNLKEALLKSIYKDEIYLQRKGS